VVRSTFEQPRASPAAQTPLLGMHTSMSTSRAEIMLEGGGFKPAVVTYGTERDLWNAGTQPALDGNRRIFSSLGVGEMAV